jgi:hypothetical protein
MSVYANNDKASKGRIKSVVKDEEAMPSDIDGKGRKWAQEIQVAQKDHKDFYECGDKVIDRYLDDTVSSAVGDAKKEKFNILWANTQLLGPAIYNRTPKPLVERRYKDKDQVGRVASEILERATSFSVESKTFDPVMVQSRDDYLLTGRGIARVWYEPVLGTDDEGEETLEFEEVLPKYVHWKDFLHQPARYWEEVEWVAFRSYLSRENFKERFPEIDTKLVKFDKSSGQYATDENDSRKDIEESVKKCEIWEIWDKPSRMVYWLAIATGKVCDAQADPLGLADFFPCPRPLLGTRSSNSVIPSPDFKFYQDQAAQLDEMTCRRAGLVRGLKMMGVYDESISELDQLINESVESDLIPVKNWMQVQQMGGLSGVMDFLPIEQTANVYTALVNNTNIVKNEVYEITGISDIVRGLSDSNETATAQQIKGQYANLRLGEKVAEMARFARDMIALMGEIIAEKFAPETIVAMAGVAEMPEQDQMLVMPALDLLRNDAMRQFRVDIETDSTVDIDQEAEKQARVEFTSTMAQYLDKIQAIAPVAPEMLPLIGESMLFTARGFKVGRGLEGVIEDTLEKLKQKVEMMQSQPQQPSPEQQKMQMEMQMKQQELELKKQEAQLDMQIKQQEAELKMQTMQREADAKIAIEQRKAQADLKAKRAQYSVTGQMLDGGVRSKQAIVGVGANGEREVRVIEEAEQPLPPPAPRQKRAVIAQDPQGNRVIQVFEQDGLGGEVLVEQGNISIAENGNVAADVTELQ